MVIAFNSYKARLASQTPALVLASLLQHEGKIYREMMESCQVLSTGHCKLRLCNLSKLGPRGGRIVMAQNQSQSVQQIPLYAGPGTHTYAFISIKSIDAQEVMARDSGPSTSEHHRFEDCASMTYLGNPNLTNNPDLQMRRP